jgi:cytochrome c oxidase subunit 1
LAVLISGIGSIGGGVNLAATILCLRCPGMTLEKMPLPPSMYLVTAGLVLIAIGPLTAAQIMLLLDRYLGAHFFDTQAGGSAVLWMHFFWIFGHPEVYILVLRAFAFIPEIVVSVSVWAHHRFTVGLSAHANSLFVLSTMAIAVPTGIKLRFFNWLATMWGGRIRFKTPMLFGIGFLFRFLIAGLTGIIMSSALSMGSSATPTLS